MEQLRKQSIRPSAQFAKNCRDFPSVGVCLCVALGSSRNSWESQGHRKRLKKQHVRFHGGDQGVPRREGGLTHIARSQREPVQAPRHRDEMADHRDHIGDPIPTGTTPDLKTLRERGDYLPPGAARVREVLDLEVAGVPDHPFRQISRQHRFEGAVFVDGDLVPIGQQGGSQEDRDNAGLHPDRRRQQRTIQIAQVETAAPRAVELPPDELPRSLQRLVVGLTETQRSAPGRRGDEVLSLRETLGTWPLPARSPRTPDPAPHPARSWPRAAFGGLSHPGR